MTVPGDPLFPRGFELAGSLRLEGLLHEASQWEIYRTKGDGRVLIANVELLREWEKRKLLTKGLFTEFKYGAHAMGFYFSEVQWLLHPIDGADGPGGTSEASAFAIALRETRRLDPDSPLQDAVYVAKLKRLLPGWTPGPSLTDDVLLGRWLSGGVEISARSTRRMRALVPFIPAVQLQDILTSAGLEETDVSNSAGLGRDKKAPTGGSGTKRFALPGRTQLEEFFNDHVIDIVVNRERYRKLGIEFPSSIVLHGPPGCGKTYAVQKLVECLDWPSFSIEASSVASPYIHDTSKKVAAVFEEAIRAAPSVLVIDEMESFLSDRRDAGSTGGHKVEEVAEFLRQIPEAGKKQVLIIGMTNMIESIDPAILRRGRFDHVIEVGMPSQQEVRSMLESELRRIPLEGDPGVDRLASALDGRPLSDAAYLVRESARLAAKAGKHGVDRACLEAALSKLDPRQPEEDHPRSRIGFGKPGDEEDK